MTTMAWLKKSENILPKSKETNAIRSDPDRTSRSIPVKIIQLGWHSLPPDWLYGTTTVVSTAGSQSLAWCPWHTREHWITSFGRKNILHVALHACMHVVEMYPQLIWKKQNEINAWRMSFVSTIHCIATKCGLRVAHGINWPLTSRSHCPPAGFRV